MDYSKLKTLIDKYYEGETSLKEEKEIRHLLKKTSGDSTFELERQMFGVFDKVKKESTPPADLEQEILSSLEAKWKADSVSRFSQPIRWIAGIAASFLLVFFVSQNVVNQPVTNKVADTYQDEKKAYKATKNVLKFVSKAMNAEAGKLTKLSQINENFSHMKNLKNLSKIKEK